MMTPINRSYPFKVWIFTLMTGPIPLYIHSIFLYGWKAMEDFPTGYYAFVLYGILFSIPTLLVSAIVYRLIKGRKLKSTLRKLIMIGMGSGLYVVTMILMHWLPPSNEAMLYLHISYTSCFLLYSFICNTTKKPKANTPETSAL